MSWWRGARVRLRAWLFRAQVEREVAEEMEWHIEMEARKHARAGMELEEARRKARLAFGGVERYRDAHRDVRGMRRVERLWYDLRYAVSALQRSPTFTAAAVLTLAIGIGANAAAFGMLHALLHRPPAGVAEPDGLFRVRIMLPEGDPSAPDRPFQVSYPDYEDLQRGIADAAELAAYWYRPVIEGHGPDAQERHALSVTRNYFSTLRVEPALGRFWTGESDDLNDLEAVISQGFWKERFGADPAVIGRSIALSEVPVRIIGVAPPHFRGIDLDPVDVWLPLEFESQAGAVGELSARNVSWLWMLIRPAAGVLPSDIEERGDRVLRSVPDSADTWGFRIARVDLAPISDPFRGYGRAQPIPSWTLGVTAVMLLIACANVSSLLLARGTGRRRELAVRTALGASRGRLVQLLLIESLLIALLGGGAGLGLAVLATRLNGLLGIPVLDRFIDVRVLAFSIGVALLTSLTVGLLSALRFSRADERDLRGGGGRVAPDRSRLRAALTVLQIALSIVLLLNAGLFARSLRNVRPGDAGFEPERIGVVSLRFQRGTPDERVREVKAASIDRLLALPGVRLATLATAAPFVDGLGIATFDPSSFDPPLPEKISAVVLDVEPGYFATVGTPLVAGRLMDETDRPGTEPVAVVSRGMARWLGGEAAAVGRCVPGRGGCARVVGVVGDFQFPSLTDEPRPVVYRPVSQYAGGPGRLRVLLRTDASADALAPLIRRELGALAPELLFIDVASMSTLLSPRLQPWRVATIIFVLVGGTAFLLAAIGLYGVISCLVLARSHEIGIRLALGARPLRIFGLVLRDGAWMTVLGTALGVLIAPPIARLLESRMFGVTAIDPWTYSLTISFVVTIAVATTAGAAGRASKIEPDSAIRSE